MQPGTRRHLAVGIASLVVITACRGTHATAGPGSGPGSRPGPSVAGTIAAVAANGEIVHIDDGDTIDVDLGGTRARVRLIGIDTPETKKPNTPVQCFGPDATALTTSLVPVGTAVRIERDVEARDPYDRLLGYVYRASDGLFVNLELARLGAARSLVIEPNTAHAHEIDVAVNAARSAKVGLWGACPAFGSPASDSPTTTG